MNLAYGMLQKRELTGGEIMKNIDNAIQELTQDPEVKEVYDRQVAIIMIARLAREMRKRAGLTQQELARKMGKQQSAISRLESPDKEVMPGLDLLIELSHACNGRLILGSDTQVQIDKNESTIGNKNKKLIAL